MILYIYINFKVVSIMSKEIRAFKRLAKQAGVKLDFLELCGEFVARVEFGACVRWFSDFRDLAAFLFVCYVGGVYSE